MSRWQNLTFLLLIALPGFGLSFLAPGTCQAAAIELRSTPLDEEAPFRRFLWVTRWDYKTPADIERICYNAASARFTDLLFQVRGEGTVFFRSPYEPWAWELSNKKPDAGVGIDPGWDPLEVVVREGRRRGLRVHAYLNVMPVWAQKVDPPRGRGQIYRDRPEWLMVDSRGRRIEPRGFYACVDPGLPEVREYLANLMGRMAADYPLDGVHLDYIRYPFETGDYSFHPRVVRLYEEQTGKKAKVSDPEWQQFRRDQISATVRAINESVKSSRPGIELSAAVIAKPEVSRVKAGQDPMAWIERGDIDAVAPMVYVEDYDSFNQILSSYVNVPGKAQVWLGIRAIEKNRILLDQIEIGADQRLSGIAVFSYESLFEKHRATKRAVDVYQTFVNYRQGTPILEYRGGTQSESNNHPVSAEPIRHEGMELKRAESGMKVRVGA